MASTLRNFSGGPMVKGNNRRPPGRPPGLREVGQPSGRRETKLDAFRRLAASRVTNAVKALLLVEKLGNREIYEIRPGDVDKIVATLRSAVDNVEYTLRQGGKPPPVIKFDE